MKLLLSIPKSRRLIFVNCISIFIAFLYFFFFVNKGIVLSDEGYYVHYAERIAQGEFVYRDFVLQYAPGYFFLLAFLYEIFGVQIIVGRFLSLFICLAIIVTVLWLLRIYKIVSIKLHITIALLLTVLGYPLLHVPIVAWSCVLIAIFLSIVFAKWNKKNSTKKLIILGVLLATALLFKQNLGVFFVIVLNLLLLLSHKKYWRKTFMNVVILNISWITIIVFLLSIYFLQTQTLAGILMMFAMSKQFIDTYVFTYPSLTMLKEPTGIFKLLPYYFPIFYAYCLLRAAVLRTVSVDKLAFGFLAIAGFFGTVFPASDLLHVYPFLGVTLTSALILFYKNKWFPLIAGIVGVFILLGVYLTFFTQSYRYEGYFLRQTQPINIPKASGIVVDTEDKSRANLRILYDYIQANTNDEEYIFVYPFAPMLYTLLERKNPSGIVQFVLLEAPESVYSEDKVIIDITQKKVRYIITVGTYKYDKKLSTYIQQQEQVFTTGPYIVFKVRTSSK